MNSVAICIPVRNAESFISELIYSLINDHDLEKIIYVSDNKSTDNTPLILNSLKKKYKELKVHYQKENIGEVRNFYFLLNWAKSEMKTEFFCWQSHDDQRIPNSLDLMASYLLKNPELIGVSCHTKRVDNSRSKLEPFLPLPLVNSCPSLRLSAEWRKPLVTKFYGLFRLNSLPKTTNMYFGDYHDQIYLDRIIAKGKVDVIPKKLFIYTENLEKRRTTNCSFLKKFPKLFLTFYKYNHIMYIYETIKLISTIKINFKKKLFLFFNFLYYFICNKIINK